ncbi:MAG: ABC transporter permease, partial [bacterium]
MFKNYLKIALRNLLKYKGYSFINVLGLAIGMACCFLILIYVQDELSYDRFHVKAESIYRIAVETESSGRQFRYPSIGGGWAAAFRNEFPELLGAARLWRFNPAWITLEDKRFSEEKFFWADSTVFEIFSFAFLQGNPKTALLAPNAVVLTEETAKKYFGTAEALNRTLGIEFNGNVVDLKITGVMENVPRNAHFHFDFLGSLSTLRPPPGADANAGRFLDSFLFTMFYTYILVPEDFGLAGMESRFPQLLEKYCSERERSFLKGLFLQSLTAIHLQSNLLNEIEPNSDIIYIYIFSAIAVLTLAIACINFINLTTARSANRAKEVGLRKVVGAQRQALVRQFLGESIFLVFISLLLAIGIVEFTMPAFNALTRKELQLDYLANPLIILGLLAIALFVGIAAGSYPALFLSAFKPIAVMKGELKAGSKSPALRRILVVAQFAVSILLIIGSSMVYKQLDFIQNGRMGFERDLRLVVPLPIANNNNLRVKTIELLKREYAKTPGVLNVSTASGVPGQLRNITPIRREGAPEDQSTSVATVDVDHEYIATLGIELKEGRNFVAESHTDSTEAFILNEEAVRQLSLDSPLGQRIVWRSGLVEFPGIETRTGPIIGVIKDMHFEPLYRKIAPMVFVIQPENYFNIVVQLGSQNVAGTISSLKNTWDKLVPNRPFQYSFLDDDLNELYQSEQRLSEVVKYFTILAIFIACLG